MSHRPTSPSKNNCVSVWVASGRMMPSSVRNRVKQAQVVAAVIVEEAGGRFTDISGRRDVFTGTAVFSNGNVHDEVLRLTGLA